MGRVKTIVKYIKFDLQVSNGAVAMAKTTLEQLLVRCATPLKDEEKTEELLAAQDKSFHMVTHDLVREVTFPNSPVRKQAYTPCRCWPRSLGRLSPSSWSHTKTWV